MAHSSIDQRNFQDSVVRGMQQLAAAVHRQNDEDSDVDEYFSITDVASFNRLNHKFKDRHLETKLVSKQKLLSDDLTDFSFQQKKRLSKIGGENARNLARNIMKYVFTNQVGRKFTWYGLKGNVRVKDTPIGDSVLGIHQFRL